MRNRPAPGRRGRATPPPPEPSAGPELANDVVVNGRYRILRRSSRWAVGNAYPAQDLSRNEPVVLVLPELAPDQVPGFLVRARIEADRTRSLHGSAIATLRDCGVLHEGLPYFVLRRVAGTSLLRYVQTNGALPPDIALHLFELMLRRVREAHEVGVVLGDIRPANVILTERVGAGDNAGLEPELIDMGFARGVFDGLLSLPEAPAAYRSPQRRMGRPLAPTDDVYALGAVLYFMLTGRAPGVQELSDEERPARVAAPPSFVRKDLELSVYLDKVVLQAMAVHAHERYQGMPELLDAVRGLRELFRLSAAARAVLRLPVDDASSRVDAFESDPTSEFGAARLQRLALDELGDSPAPFRAGTTQPFDTRELARLNAEAQARAAAPAPVVEVPPGPPPSEGPRIVRRKTSPLGTSPRAPSRAAQPDAPAPPRFEPPADALVPPRVAQPQTPRVPPPAWTIPASAEAKLPVVRDAGTGSAMIHRPELAPPVLALAPLRLDAEPRRAPASPPAERSPTSRRLGPMLVVLGVFGGLIALAWFATQGPRPIATPRTTPAMRSPPPFIPTPEVRPAVPLPPRPVAVEPAELAPAPVLPPSAQAPAPDPAPVAEAPAPAPSPPAPPGPPVTLKFETLPEGARVLQARGRKVLCEATPCDATHRRLEPGKKIRVRLELPGHASREASVPLDESGTYRFALVPMPSSEEPAPRGPEEPVEATGPGAAAAEPSEPPAAGNLIDPF